jgi:lantibiotic modifying enzyme
MTLPTQTWRPILRGRLADQAWSAVRAIAKELRVLHHRINDPSLAEGNAGIALLFTYLHMADPDGRGDYDETARDILALMKMQMGGIRRSASLYFGLTGIAWVVEHLQGRLFEPSLEDPNAGIDEILPKLLTQSLSADLYDLFSGQIGIGVYALERLPRSSAKKCLNGVVLRLRELAEPAGKTIRWPFPASEFAANAKMRELYPRGGYDFGMAHGLAGVIAFLGQIPATAVAQKRTQPLLESAVAQLLLHRLPPNSISAFPPLLDPSKAPTISRLAWCRGDPSTSMALFLAARGQAHQDWEQMAREVAHVAARRTVKTSGVVDGGLCHGAAGLGHIFNRLYQATEDTELGNAAQFWFAQVLAMRKKGHGIAGYSAVRQKNVRRNNPGFLMGAAGIALALLAALTPVPPDWDRLLLLSSAQGQSKARKLHSPVNAAAPAPHVSVAS